MSAVNTSIPLRLLHTGFFKKGFFRSFLVVHRCPVTKFHLAFAGVIQKKEIIRFTLPLYIENFAQSQKYFFLFALRTV